MTAKNIKKNGYNSHFIKNLAHIISSPPLLTGPGYCSFEWLLQQYDKHIPWLQKLDKQPTPEELISIPVSHKPLGKQFEAYLEFWLHESPHLKLIASNVQVIHKGETLGEIDYIFTDNETGITYHWEVAIKFYLAAANSPEHSNFIGPGGKDRLDLKTSKMKEKQVPLIRTKHAKKVLKPLDTNKVRSGILLKGIIFHHLNQNNITPLNGEKKHLKGIWIREKELLLLKDIATEWAVLEKKEWVEHDENLEKKEKLYIPELKTRIAEEFHSSPFKKKGIMLFNARAGKNKRIMVVRNNWPQSK